MTAAATVGLILLTACQGEVAADAAGASGVEASASGRAGSPGSSQAAGAAGSGARRGDAGGAGTGADRAGASGASQAGASGSDPGAAGRAGSDSGSSSACSPPAGVYELTALDGHFTDMVPWLIVTAEEGGGCTARIAEKWHDSATASLDGFSDDTVRVRVLGIGASGGTRYNTMYWEWTWTSFDLDLAPDGSLAGTGVGQYTYSWSEEDIGGSGQEESPVSVGPTETPSAAPRAANAGAEPSQRRRRPTHGGGTLPWRGASCSRRRVVGGLVQSQTAARSQSAAPAS